MGERGTKSSNFDPISELSLSGNGLDGESRPSLAGYTFQEISSPKKIAFHL
jgi:hypothetical protein